MASTGRTYNGRPLFSVSEDDFIYVMEAMTLGTRLIAKKIVSDELREMYVASRHPEFAVEFDNTVILYGK